MCGFVVRVGTGGPSEVDRVCTLAARLGHRGPDGAGTFMSDRSAMAHARLAIVDVAGGAQPMVCGPRSAIVYNGEVYNHDALRAELRREGTEFESRSDTEVVLRAVERWGLDALSRLDGMFSFVAVDGDRFVAARDALGIKPLYTAREADGARWFASELKGLPRGVFDVEAVPPGTVMTETGVAHWYDGSWGEMRKGAPSTARLCELLQAAVDKRLMSDVDVGAFLSGGLDSSVVGALMAARRGPIPTFAVGVGDAPDLQAAREVAAWIGSTHQEARLSARDVIEAVPTVIDSLESYDVALVRSSVPCFFVSRLAADSRVKVVLTGEGADELFGGYSYFGTISEPARFHAECARLLRELHHLNLQRLDRMTMAHGVEGRVPFLDLDVVHWVMGLDPATKVWRGIPEKLLLRGAFDRWLPESVVWRRKVEFAAGSGVEQILASHADEVVSDHDWRIEQSGDPGHSLTKEAVWYRRLFDERFPEQRGRWSIGQWMGQAQPGGEA
jgi:asparagine synthase (glutamine-hydrolysing)